MTADLTDAAARARGDVEWHAGAKPGARWQVVRQCGHDRDRVVSTHRFELLAEWHARRRTARSTERGVHYNARRAES